MASRGNILRGHDSEPDAEYVKSISAPQASLTTGSMSRASVGDVMEDAERSIRLQQELHASRKGDAKVHGEPMEVETRSDSAGDMESAPGGRRPMSSFDPERFLVVELEAAKLKRVLDAGTKAKAPVRLRLEITVHPRNASGFPRVVGDRVSSIADIVEDTPFDPLANGLSIGHPKAPVRSAEVGGMRARARRVAKPMRNSGAGTKGSTHLREKIRQRELQRKGRAT
jgi:hypothetical protein